MSVEDLEVAVSHIFPVVFARFSELAFMQPRETDSRWGDDEAIMPQDKRQPFLGAAVKEANAQNLLKAK